jgi:hypothetical protein
MPMTHIATAALLPHGAPPELITAINDAARNAFARHGAVAFEAPPEAASAHEASHAIVATHEGFTVRRIAIYPQSAPILGTVWSGRCFEVGGAWTTDHDSTAEDDLRRARVVIAGLAGEALAGLDKPGSSLDELALSQLIACNVAAKLADPALSDADHSTYTKNLWHERVWKVARAILRANDEVFQQLTTHLNEHQEIEGVTLDKILANVKGIAS